MRDIPFQSTALALAIAFACLPASAQEAIQNTDEAQLSEPDNVEKASLDEQKTEVIMVTGVRSSMTKAQDLKMESDSILDAIVAEDIGKLPDHTVAESIARIAGVQVTRNGDEADGFLIRGIPDVTTTYNGREIFTAELRRVQLQDFPSQAISGVEIYKSGTANIIEPGLGGLVNVNTRRPLDFDGAMVAGGFHYTYNDQNGAKDPSGSILLSNRWETEVGDIGFLLNGTYASGQWHHGNRYNSVDFWIAPDWWTINDDEHFTGGFVVPVGVGLYNTGGKRTRPSANFSLQWRPSANAELYFEGLYQGYRGESFVDNIHLNLVDYDNVYWLGGNQPVLDDLVVENGGAQSFTKSGGRPAEMFRSTTEDKTDTYQLAIGGRWNTDALTIESDLAYTNSYYQKNSYSLDSYLDQAYPISVDFNKDQGVAFDMPVTDLSDASKYLWRGYFESAFKPKGEGAQFRLDLTYDTGSDLFHTLQAGIRLNRRTAELQNGVRYADTKDLRIPLTDLPIGDLQMLPDTFRTNAQGLTSYLTPSRNGVYDNHDALRIAALEAVNQTLELWPDWQVEAGKQFQYEDVQYNPRDFFSAEEDSYAFYLQTKYSFDIDYVEFDGVLGLRAVQTEATTQGTSVIVYEGEETITPRSITNSYLDLLPNVSLKARYDEFQFRAGYTKTRTRVNFGDLNPALKITQVGSNYGPEAPADASTPVLDEEGNRTPDAYGSTGNPDLDPLVAHNFDLSAEWYFSESGYASIAGFYKKIKGWTNWYTRRIEDDTYGYLELTRPENSGEGKLAGVELNFQTFLNYAWAPTVLHPLGVSANVTHLTGEDRKPDENGEFGDYQEMLGLSEWTFNSAIFYEKQGFGSRLSYNYRSDWTNWINTGSLDGRKNYTEARDRLDFSIWYDLKDNLTVYFDVSNILAKPFVNKTLIPATHQNAELPAELVYAQDVRDEGRYFGGGIRFKF